MPVLLDVWALGGLDMVGGLRASPLSPRTHTSPLPPASARLVCDLRRHAATATHAVGLQKTNCHIFIGHRRQSSPFNGLLTGPVALAVITHNRSLASLGWTPCVRFAWEQLVSHWAAGPPQPPAMVIWVPSVVHVAISAAPPPPINAATPSHVPISI